MRDLRNQLQDYVEANVERVDADDVRLAVSQPTAQSMLSRPRLTPALAFVLGAAFVLAVGGLVMFLRADQTPLDETASPGVFAFAESDLCEWVSDDDMTSFVREAYAQVGVEWDGSAVSTIPMGSAWDEYDYCRWRLTGGGHVLAGALDPSRFGGAAIEFPTLNEATPIGTYSGHPALPENVIVGNAAFGRYGFWVEGSAEALGLEMLSADAMELEWVEQDEVLLSLANRLLHSMGWTATEGEWNPILESRQAKSAPSPAVCPDGADPDVVGPLDQARPWGAQWSNQAAAFDTRTGRIVFFDEKGGTWTFDVCTNTWEEMNPEFRLENGQVWPDDPDGWLGQLVYDVDSDRTVAFRGEFLAVYDAEANTWTLRSQPPRYETGIPGSGAVYHAGSGLIVVQTWESGLVAYDVDTDTWIPIGTVEWTGQVPPYLVGYRPQTGQFVFLGGFDDRGMLVDARTGKVIDMTTPEGGVFAGFGRLDYATGGNTAYLVRPADGDGGDVCELNPYDSSWKCVTMSNGPKGFGQGSGLLAASTYDPVNARIILLYGYGDGFNGQRFHEVNDIWAVDIDTAQWTQLVERSGETIYENETESWIRDEPFGIRLALEPSKLPPVPGRYQIEVDVSHREDWTGIHVCADLGGVLEPDLATQVMGDVCRPLTPISAVIDYPTSVTVEVTDLVIADGGLVIGVNAAFGDWAGTALIDISEP